MNSRRMKRATGLLSVVLAGLLIASCSQTSSPAPSQGAQAPAVQAAPPPPMASVQPSQPGAAVGQYEEPPVVNVADLVPAAPLSGAGYTVQPQAPTNGAMGQYTIVADPSVFHDDAGTYYVENLDMLKIRLSEIPAIAQLDAMSNTDVYAKALASSAVRPVTAAANMVLHPMDTVTGLPGGVGDLFGRVSMGAGEIASSATNSFGSGKLEAVFRSIPCISRKKACILACNPWRFTNGSGGITLSTLSALRRNATCESAIAGLRRIFPPAQSTPTCPSICRDRPKRLLT